MPYSWLLRSSVLSIFFVAIHGQCTTCGDCDADASACNADPACRVLVAGAIAQGEPPQICVEIGTCESNCALCSNADCETASRARCFISGATGTCVGGDCQLSCTECTLGGDGTDCDTSEAEPNGCVFDAEGAEDFFFFFCTPRPTDEPTAAPTTAAPTTSAPTTASPTTSAPTTASPTTGEPTTASSSSSDSSDSSPTLPTDIPSLIPTGNPTIAPYNGLLPKLKYKSPDRCATCGDCDADASACDADPACRVLTGEAIDPNLLPLAQICVEIGTCDSDCALCGDADCQADASRANCLLEAPGFCTGVGCQLSCLACNEVDDVATDCAASEAEPNGCVLIPGAIPVCVDRSVSVGDDDRPSSDDADSMDGISGAGGSNNDYAMDESRLLGMSESQTNVMYTLLVTGAFAVLAIAIGVWCFFRRSSSGSSAWLSKRHRCRAQRLDTYDMDEEEEEHDIEMENDVEKTKLNASFAAHGESDNL